MLRRECLGVLMIPSCMAKPAQPDYIERAPVVAMGGGDAHSITACLTPFTGRGALQDTTPDSSGHNIMRTLRGEVPTAVRLLPSRNRRQRIFGMLGPPATPILTALFRVLRVLLPPTLGVSLAVAQVPVTTVSI